MTDQADKNPAEADDTKQASQSEESETVVVDSHTISVDRPELAWSQADGSDEPRHQPWRSVWGIVAVISVVAAGVIGLVVWLVSRSGLGVPPPKPSAAPSLSSSVAAPAPTSTVPPVTTVTVKPTETAPAISRAGFFGEWGSHARSVTLAPDGSAHYFASQGAVKGASWSATWSPMTSTTAMIVLATQLNSYGDTSDPWVHRYSGEAFTFTLRPDGYATITDPSGEPITLCPIGTGFQDTQRLCGA
jgi:hypothetical protein